MVMLVTLQQAKDHLRTDTDDGDADLLLKLKGASRAVLNYINGSLKTAEFTDSSGEPLEDSDGVAMNIPEDVQIATLFTIGAYDHNRASNSDDTFDGYYLPAPAKSLLYQYRDHTLA